MSFCGCECESARIAYGTLQRDTMIRPVSEMNPNLRYFFNGLSPFILIAKRKVPNPSNIDIIGVVLNFEDPASIPIRVSLSQEMTLLQGPNLMEAARAHSVVIAKRFKYSDIPTIDSKNESDIQAIFIDQFIAISKGEIDKGETPTLTEAKLENISKISMTLSEASPKYHTKTRNSTTLDVATAIQNPVPTKKTYHILAALASKKW
ncbi:hypothetical protein LIER_04635 [Lithospermum erythrorhizon]|uniref:Uncharacterized protein n=1 Tax=Lithospermum erythrorhizon TaxID=34254 RepID=A0AAV3NZ29_LITER